MPTVQGVLRQLGWRLDADFGFDNGFRVIQFTPPGSAASIQFGSKITAASPGSVTGLYLVVSDILAAHERSPASASRSAACSIPEHRARSSRRTSGRVDGPAADRTDLRLFATFSDPDGNAWLLQEVDTSTSRPHRCRRDPSHHTVDLADAMRRAAVAHGEHEKRRRGVRRELARLVRRLHGGGTGRDGMPT